MAMATVVTTTAKLTVATLTTSTNIGMTPVTAIAKPGTATAMNFMTNTRTPSPTAKRPMPIPTTKRPPLTAKRPIPTAIMGTRMR